MAADGLVHGPRFLRIGCAGQEITGNGRGKTSGCGNGAVAVAAFAPGTGTPEPGGFSSYQMLQLMRGLKGLNLVGMDLVEVSPPYDHADVTAILAANLVFEYLCLVALNKK